MRLFSKGAWSIEVVRLRTFIDLVKHTHCVRIISSSLIVWCEKTIVPITEVCDGTNIFSLVRQAKQLKLMSEALPITVCEEHLSSCGGNFLGKVSYWSLWSKDVLSLLVAYSFIESGPIFKGLKALTKWQLVEIHLTVNLGHSCVK